MVIRRRFALVLAILWLSPTSLHAQSDALMEAHRQGQTHYEAGQYDQAVLFFRVALGLGKTEFGLEHTTTAKLVAWLA